jgi:hypothetical protein
LNETTILAIVQGIVMSVGLAFATTARAERVPNVPLSGRSLVTLVLTANAKNGCGPAKLDFIRVKPDGSASADAFRIPDGQARIVTDVDWLYSNGGPGLTEVLLVLIESLADSSTRQTVLQSTIRLGVDGAGGASEHSTSGFLVSSSARVCVDVIPGPVGSPLRLSNVVLRGYLVGAP